MNRTATRFGVAATVANAVGLALAVYLTVEHYSASPSYLCPATSVLNCQKVTESSYAVVFGVPVALAGLVYFVASIPLHLPAAWRSTSV
ncbi:MAG: Vitamin K epoxide reductase, partial [Actinobacteria bacterium]|nr:Vitamin K epoxide reductase [Actinomycetota bacterium]